MNGDWGKKVTLKQNVKLTAVTMITTRNKLDIICLACVQLILLLLLRPNTSCFLSVSMYKVAKYWPFREKTTINKH
jgi:hypothetical protein